MVLKYSKSMTIITDGYVWDTVIVFQLLYTNIDQTLMNSLHGILNCEIGGLDCRVITTV